MSSRPVPGLTTIVVPATVIDAGEAATRQFLEFFAVTSRKRNTDLTAYRAIRRFFTWCEHHQLGALHEIEPLHIEAYFEHLHGCMKAASSRQHLEPIRKLFAWLVTGQALPTNPAHTLRIPKPDLRRDKIPALALDPALALLDSVDTSTLIGLRDRALIGVVAYSSAGVGAAVAMRVEDYAANRQLWWTRLQKKRDDAFGRLEQQRLVGFIDQYLEAAKFSDDPTSPLFRAAKVRSATLGVRAMSQADAYRMIHRRGFQAWTPLLNGRHAFPEASIISNLESRQLNERRASCGGL